MASITNIKAFERRLSKALAEQAKGNKYYKGDTLLEINRASGLLEQAKNYKRDFKGGRK